jgi:hypothetical protein
MGPANNGCSGERRPYNFIYEKLVSAPDDIVGMIAYSLYKKEKVEYIRNFATQYGMAPEEQDLQSFHVSSNTQARLSGYRVQAKEIAREFLEIALEEKVEEIESQLLADFQLTQIGSDLRELRKFRPAVIQGFVSSWLFAASIGLVVLLSALARLGPKDVVIEVGRLFNLEIRDSKPATGIKSQPGK